MKEGESVKSFHDTLCLLRILHDEEEEIAKRCVNYAESILKEVEKFLRK